MLYPDIQQHSPALRQAIISIIPDFYRHNSAERHALFSALTPDQHEQFERALSQRLFQKACIHADLSEKHANVFNQHLLPLQGLGTDCFFLNESFSEDKPMPSFATLLAYDYDDWEYQETSMVEHSPNYQRETDYYGRLCNAWARCLNSQGELVYLTLSTVAAYLADISNDTMDDLIEHYIPHNWVEGPQHGNTSEGGRQWDLKVDANGLEGQLEWLKERCYRQLRPRQQHHAKAFSSQSPQVMWVDRSNDKEHAAEVLFINHHTLANIRLDHFLNDCKALLIDESPLKKWEEDEKAWCKTLVEEEYQYVIKHYDPTIVDFRRAKKIIVADSAMDDIERLFQQDDDEPS